MRKKEHDDDGDQSVTNEECPSNMHKLTVDLHGEADKNKDVFAINMVESESKTSQITKESEAAHPNTMDESFEHTATQHSNHTLVSDEDRCIMKILKTEPVVVCE